MQSPFADLGILKNKFENLKIQKYFIIVFKDLLRERPIQNILTALD